VGVVAVVRDVNYSTLLKSSAEEPLKPVTSDMTRRAKKARQRSAKYETAAVVEEDEEVPAWTSPINSQAESDRGDVRDGGDDRTAHDVWPGSNLQEMPRPVLRGECS
jgi:hypothetical protein